MNKSILLKSNFYRINAWNTDNTGKVLKPRAELFKDLLPGDYLIFSTELGSNNYFNFKVEAYRYDQVIGEIEYSKNPTIIMNIINKYFELEEIKNSIF